MGITRPGHIQHDLITVAGVSTAHEVPLRVEGLPRLCGRHAGDHCSQVQLDLSASTLPVVLVSLQPSAIQPADPEQMAAAGKSASNTCATHLTTESGTHLRSNFEDTEDASLDPEPIMVTEAEQDAALSAILDQNIGIGPNGWDPKLERR
jgi:hypothetical protein